MKNKKLGLPYMGSKRRLSREIVDHILTAHPNTKYVWDLFGGGGAISFEFLQRPQIERVVYNELNTGVVELLRKIQKDGVTPEFYQWVDRDTFHAHKSDDDWFGGLCAVVWSFGSGQRNYLFGKHIEETKRQAHECVVNGTPFELDGVSFNALHGSTINERRLSFRRIVAANKGRFDLQHLEQLQRLQQLQRLEHLQRLKQSEQLEHLEQLQRLQRLEQLQQLEILNQSAFDVVVDTPVAETIIYLDPPYKGTAKYQEDVCHDELKRYIDNSPYTVYLSSYDFDLPVVKQMKHRSTLSSTANNATVEKLFCNKTEHKNTLF